MIRPVAQENGVDSADDENAYRCLMCCSQQMYQFRRAIRKSIDRFLKGGYNLFK